MDSYIKYEDKPKVKPQIAKKLRKDKRQQKLLQQLDKAAYEKSQKHINNIIEERLGKKKKKRQKIKGTTTATEDNDEDNMSIAIATTEDVDNTPPKKQGRKYSVSIAVAGSVLDNAQTPQLKAYLVGQISRACGIFNVDEVIVYDDTGGNSTTACELMARILQYLETPPYLRKYLFEIHSDFQYVGLIAPLDIPHHLRRHEALHYREGIVSSKPAKDGKEISHIYVGLDRDCRVEKKLPENARVTIKFDNPSPNYILKPKGKLRGIVVSPSLPRTEGGYYWGYTVRIADSLTKVFSDCPFKETYDLKIGTSENGTEVKGLGNKFENEFKHALIVFGGVKGLEYALENDESSMEDDVSNLFDFYLNTCPNQGSRTIRTEEAILISMTCLAPVISNSFL